MSFDVIRAARAAGQKRLLQIVAVAAGTYPDDTPEHVQARRLVLGPVMRQNEDFRQHLRVRRSAPDVNPDTGEPEPPSLDAEPSANATPPTEPVA